MYRRTPIPIVREGLENLAVFRLLAFEVRQECAKNGYIADLLENFDYGEAAPPADV